MANTYLTRTTGTSPTSRQKFTVSAWFKLSATSGNRSIFCIETDGNTTLNLLVQGTNKLQFVDYNSSAEQAKLQTNRLFRDTNGFYNVVLAVDSTQATNTNRLKMYINGVQETSFSSTVYPSQNYNFTNNVGNTRIGISSGVTNYFDGSMSHINFIDGTAYDASYFGSTDSTTGEWKINTSPSVTYGTNGFFILKDGNSVTDQSGEGNNFTVGGGNLTKTEDSPSNVFATFNPLAQTFSSISYEHGNTTNATSADVGQRQSISTLGSSSGKFYMECKLQAIGSNVGGSFPYAGIVAQSKYAGNTYVGGNGCGWTTGGDVYNGGGSATSSGVSYTTGDIIGLAVDITNSKMYWHKNGTYIFSGNPSAGTGGFDISARTSEDAIGFATSLYNNNGTWQCNFGNGYFGSTQISSAGTNASGNGIFEYDVPANFTALSTKGLNL